MLRFSDIVFGPVSSRRLGSSLGVNLLPPDGKFCNFDCIYCECGWNKDGLKGGKMPDAAAVRAAMGEKFPVLASSGVKVDSITFSGNGEPTLNPDFPEIIDITVEMRDRYLPGAVISVLSNIAPAYVHDMVYKYLDGDVEGSRKMQLDAVPICDALFCEVNPIPVKAAMNLMGKEAGPLRAPLTEIEPAHREELKKIMKDFGIL